MHLNNSSVGAAKAKKIDAAGYCIITKFDLAIQVPYLK
jgi:hypothetical protein